MIMCENSKTLKLGQKKKSHDLNDDKYIFYLNIKYVCGHIMKHTREQNLGKFYVWLKVQMWLKMVAHI